MIRAMRAIFLASLPVLAAARGEPAWCAEDIAFGRELAEAKCGRCHALGSADDSPHPSAPPFRHLEKRWPLENLEEALAEGITTGHPDMPEFRFDPDEIAALLAFMKSLSDANRSR